MVLSGIVVWTAREVFFNATCLYIEMHDILLVDLKNANRSVVSSLYDLLEFFSKLKFN